MGVEGCYPVKDPPHFAKSNMDNCSHTTTKCASFSRLHTLEMRQPAFHEPARWMLMLVGGLLLLLAMILRVFLLYKQRCNTQKSAGECSLTGMKIPSREAPPQQIRGHEVAYLTTSWRRHQDVLAKRVGLNRIRVGDSIISNNRHTSVHLGYFQQRCVAVKKLTTPGEDRAMLQRADQFMQQIRLLASLDHPNIVTLTAVAWDHPMDLCVVTEFMNQRGLRTFLTRQRETGQATGFDGDKLAIASQIASALVYLHSRTPPIVHSRLTSKRVLLNDRLEAKLTGFGAAQVEVAARDAKEDIFAFGTLLFEMDSYQVFSPVLRLEFASRSPPCIVQLAKACLSTDPLARPSAVEVSRRIERIIRARNHPRE